MDIFAWLNDQLLRMNWLSELVRLLVEKVFGLDMASRLGGSLHFFIYDVIKIFILLSVLMYIVIPLAIAQLLRAQLLKRGAEAFQAALARISPFSILALLATLVLLFSFQGEAIVEQPLVIGLLAVPILLQTLFIAALGYWLCRRLRVRHEVAGPATMIGASNFFELAVAVAIVLYGFDSGAALATVVGVLIEVPVMLWLVRMVNRSRAWYERALPRQ